MPELHSTGPWSVLENACGKTMTYQEVIRACHGQPYPSDEELEKITAEFYKFQLLQEWRPGGLGDHVTVGWLFSGTVNRLPWTDQFEVDHSAKTIRIPYNAREDHETLAIAEFLDLSRAHFPSLAHWEPEFYRIWGVERHIRIARGGSALLGIQTMGIQMTGYVFDERTTEMNIWVPRRSANRRSHPGKMDNTVGGGTTADEQHFETMIREAREEASFPQDYMREHARFIGSISYFFVRPPSPDDGLVQIDRSLQYIYDIELPSHIIPKPSDGEVEAFYLWSIPQTMSALQQGQFKSNAAVTLIDFLIRHGYINSTDEPELEEITKLIRRRSYA
ncbi:hypothetical protein CAC42_2057 [Sphaceloma murrayae]|uniref:Nudix hydrolase domain-containing protein n=1 Tax=Sphaceloma murrayae TaxID=2082308 RepID=A0A2K1QI35_9PEZI|nr:hypothetical protein CAC42_2057 [Sphaceloma murrayae]